MIDSLKVTICFECTMDSENAMIISTFRPVSLPATACQPAGSVPVCPHGLPEALKADGGELLQSKTKGLTSEDLPLITVCSDKAKRKCPGNGCQRL